MVLSDAGEDGVSILPQLLGKASSPAREATVHQSSRGDLAIRQGPWKMIFMKNGSRELYNLEQDIAETRDRFPVEPNVAIRLETRMRQIIANGRSTPGPVQKNEFALSIDSTKRSAGWRGWVMTNPQIPKPD